MNKKPSEIIQKYYAMFRSRPGGNQSKDMIKAIILFLDEQYSTPTSEEKGSWSQCNDCFDSIHDKCIGKDKGCECEHLEKSLNK